MQMLRIEAARQRIHQIGAMEGQMRRAIAFEMNLRIAEFELLAGMHVAGKGAGVDIRDGQRRFADADRPQCFDGLGADIDAGADLGEG